MRSNRLVQILVAVFLAALVLVLVCGPLHRSRTGQPVLTHEIRDLIATLQAPLEPRGTTDGNFPPGRGTTHLLLVLLGGAVLGAAAWTFRVRRRQQRDRSSSS